MAYLFLAGNDVWGSVIEADTACLRAVLNDGTKFDINRRYPPWRNSTPLLWAARHDQDDICQVLIKNGADFNLKDVDGVTPLLWAVVNNNGNLARYLTERGADINVQCTLGRTPLSVAVRKGNMDVVRYLTENGARLSLLEKSGTDFVMELLERKYQNMLKYLIREGLPVPVIDKDSFNYSVRLCQLYRGISKPDPGLLRLILEGMHRDFIEGFLESSGIAEKLSPDALREAQPGLGSLKLWCRSVIRSAILDSAKGCCLSQSIDQLHLPNRCKQFLKFSELEVDEFSCR